MELTGASGSPYVFAAPVLPGKEEPWRRFLQEVAEARSEYERLRRRLGVRRELAWLVPSPRGEMAIVYLEVEDLDELGRRLVASEEAFDVWVKEKILECLGRAGLRALPESALEPIFSLSGDREGS